MPTMTTEGTGHGSVERSFPRIINKVVNANLADKSVSVEKLANQVVEIIGSGGGGGDYLPLSGGTMEGAIEFGSGGANINEGSFDNGTSGAGGISLNCSVGYELNWQGGRLSSSLNGGANKYPIHFDSSVSVEDGDDSVVVSATGITFPDGTVQTTAGSKVVDLTYAATLNTDASAGDIFDVTLTGNATLANPTNPVNGQTLRWRITQDATGNRAVTLGSKFNIPSSATSPLPFSTAAGKMDVLAATYHAGRDKWDIIAFVMGY
jgi:hypothetical protein